MSLTKSQRELAEFLNRIERTAKNLKDQTLSIKNDINSSLERATAIFEAAGVDGAKLLLLSASNIANANENDLLQSLTPSEAVRILAMGAADLQEAESPIPDPTPKEAILAQLMAWGYRLASLPDSKVSPHSPHNLTPESTGEITVTAIPDPEPEPA